MRSTNDSRTWIIAVGGVLVVVVLAVVIGVVVSSGRSDGVDEVGSSSPPTSVPAGAGADRPATSDSDRDRPAPEGDRSGEAVLSDRTIQFGIIQREYLVMSPSWADRGTPLPLVVALHGMATDRWEMVQAADWRRAVQQRGFVAVFPQGFANSWNSGSCCPPSSLAAIDDVGFLDSVIAAVEESESIDPERVFVTGFSNGGIMSYRYGCSRADRLAAIAPMSGSNLEGCVPDHPLSLLHHHSDPDSVVPYDGGFGVGQLLSSNELPPVLGSVAGWATAVGCGSETRENVLTDEVTTITWQDCPVGTEVELVRIAGHGHVWPRTSDYDGFEAMLDFFGLS